MGAILERKGGAEQENAADHISRQGNKMHKYTNTQIHKIQGNEMQHTKYKARQANEMQYNAKQYKS